MLRRALLAVVAGAALAATATPARSQHAAGDGGSDGAAVPVSIGFDAV